MAPPTPDHEFHEDIERHPEHVRVAAHKVRKEIHDRREREHQNQVLNSRPRNVTLVWRLR